MCLAIVGCNNMSNSQDENPDGTIILDFNKAYNPYCAYNETFSCPLTPEENTLTVAILAGAKNYKKE